MEYGLWMFNLEIRGDFIPSWTKKKSENLSSKPGCGEPKTLKPHAAF